MRRFRFHSCKTIVSVELKAFKGVEIEAHSLMVTLHVGRCKEECCLEKCDIQSLWTSCCSVPIQCQLQMRANAIRIHIGRN